jgi:hypothetical protein
VFILFSIPTKFALWSLLYIIISGIYAYIVASTEFVNSLLEPIKTRSAPNDVGANAPNVNDLAAPFTLITEFPLLLEVL